MLNSGAIRSPIDERYKNGNNPLLCFLFVVFFFSMQLLTLLPDKGPLHCNSRFNSLWPHLTGSITMEEVLTVLPFGGTFDLVKIKGSTMKMAFEHCVHRYGSMTGEFLQVSG